MNSMLRFKQKAFTIAWSCCTIFSYLDTELRVFVFGEYEFLCALHGIAGANGKYTHF